MAISYVCAKCGTRMNADQSLVRDLLCPVCRVPMRRDDVVAAPAPASAAVPVPAVPSVMGGDKPRPTGLKVTRIVAPPPGGVSVTPTGSAGTGKGTVAATVMDPGSRMTETGQEALRQASEQAGQLVAQAKTEAAALLAQAQQTADETAKQAQEQAVLAAAAAKVAAEKMVAAAQAAVDQGLAAAQAEAVKITEDARTAAEKVTAVANAAAATVKDEAGRQKLAADKMLAEAKAAADQVTGAATAATEKMTAEAKIAAEKITAEAKAAADQLVTESRKTVAAVASPSAEAQVPAAKPDEAKPKDSLPASDAVKAKTTQTEIVNRQTEVTKAVKREANLLMGGIVGSAVTALYLVFVLMKTPLPPPVKFITWLMLIADTGAFAFLVAIICGHYAAGTKAVAKHKERLAAPTPITPGALRKAVGPTKTGTPVGKPGGAFKMSPSKKPFVLAKPKTGTPPPGGTDGKKSAAAGGNTAGVHTSTPKSAEAKAADAAKPPP